MVEIRQDVPRDKFYVFHDIIKVTGGRYLSNPVYTDKIVSVHFTSSDLAAHMTAWTRANTSIVETYRKPTLWVKFKKLFKL